MRLYNIISVPKNSIRENEMRYSCKDHFFDPFRFSVGDFVKSSEDPRPYYRIAGIDREWVESADYWVERLHLEEVKALQLDLSFACDFVDYAVDEDGCRIELSLECWAALSAGVEVGKDIFVHSLSRTPGIGRITDIRDIGSKRFVTIAYAEGKDEEEAEHPAE